MQALPFIPPSTPRTPELSSSLEAYATERSSSTRRTKLVCLPYGQYFTSNFLVYVHVIKSSNFVDVF